MEIYRNIMLADCLKKEVNFSLAFSLGLHICLAAWLMHPSSEQALVIPLQQVITVELVAMEASKPLKQAEPAPQPIDATQPEKTEIQEIIKPTPKNPEITKKIKPAKKQTKQKEQREENVAHSASGEAISDADRTHSAAATEVIFDAAYLNNPPPKYPPTARRNHVEGKVLLTVIVSEHGSADSVAIKTSSGHELLDEAAIDAVKHWRFVPAKQNNIAIAANIIVPVIFKIEG
jgi:periplasmic protein TonB